MCIGIMKFLVLFWNIIYILHPCSAVHTYVEYFVTIGVYSQTKLYCLIREVIFITPQSPCPAGNLGKELCVPCLFLLLSPFPPSLHLSVCHCHTHTHTHWQTHNVYLICHLLTCLSHYVYICLSHWPSTNLLSLFLSLSSFDMNTVTQSMWFDPEIGDAV